MYIYIIALFHFDPFFPLQPSIKGYTILRVLAIVLFSVGCYNKTEYNKDPEKLNTSLANRHVR